MASPSSLDRSAWRERLYVIIFESDTPAGKAFDVVLIGAILLSVGVVTLESVRHINADYGRWLRGAEWGFTLLFTVEYVLRLFCARRPWRYATSFYGVVDLLAVVPTYLSAFVPGAQHLIAVRVLRTLRVFRVLKLAEYLAEANVLLRALRASRRKITVFVFAVSTLVVILGSFMYLIEGAENGFTSIPTSIYWAIVTLTTVGYGDISPQTPAGRMLSAVIMIIGYGIIAVPTGIVTAEIARVQQEGGRPGRRTCPDCGAAGHDPDAAYCKRCGAILSAPAAPAPGEGATESPSLGEPHASASSNRSSSNRSSSGRPSSGRSSSPGAPD
jgi:voltage-gated potassium channel